MWEMIKFEYRKYWNGVTITAIAALCVVSTLHTFIYLNGLFRTIDGNGEIVEGLAAFRVLKEVSGELEGVIDGDYIKELKRKYDDSVEKQYLEEHRGFMGTGGMTRFMQPNYFLNYAYFGPYMSNGNDKTGLDHDYLDSEEHFYQKYRETVREHILLLNQFNGLFPFTDKQIKVIDRKIADLKTPFYVTYVQGLSNLMNWWNMEYPAFFAILAFILACAYAGNSVSGVDELTLACAYGRGKNFRARLLSGNLLTVTAYLIFSGVLAVEHGIVGSWYGGGSSAQTYWFNCLLNISVGTGIAMKFAGGLLGALVMANFVMLLSMKIKNMKGTAAASLLFVWGLKRASNTYSQIKLLNPLWFGSDAVIDEFFFAGNIFVPYLLWVIVFSVIYIGAAVLLMRRTAPEYHI